MDVPATAAVGTLVGAPHTDGNGSGGLREHTEGSEWRHATGNLFGDVQRDREGCDDQHGTDTIHGAIEFREPNSEPAPA
jgi:hypothetical protein